MQRTPIPADIRKANAPRVATDPQKNYVKALIEGKDLSSLSNEQRDYLEQMDVSKMSFDHAQKIIPVLKELSWAQGATLRSPAISMAEMPDVPDGRYAVCDPTDADPDKLKFFKLKNGNKPGFVFLDVYAIDKRFPIYRTDHKLAVIQEIAKDPLAAMKLFGEKIGKCGRCGRTLTDPVSRAFGIGPDCREMMGI